MVKILRDSAIDQNVFQPHWPENLKPKTSYRFLCDDKGADGTTFLDVYIDDQGDAYVTMQEWENPKEKDSKPHPLPSVRCRTLQGGGHHMRTRQALLWLAEAIRLDNEELGIKS